ncbi:histidinol-phosphate aminotransferase family protein [Vibrio vulnificus]|uniref:pyridoxal phosphate-dependent aminotransferase n=1 Tax=Vibrio vulnificus TaxID=672 RepID=UPI001028AD55|nr:histidinol-phosphate transaminase [Vibrio vulnificus]EGR7968223.1 histidinol-phosphate aminotransferase family protein [Vibrio vulnificus]RZP72472.1 histidinol-phosphate aminotransferase family protein [Vibrio vulnificus]RZP73843.1 histidinol-phosphate aminotransferase family protein [Vibrio vulnificus]
MSKFTLTQLDGVKPYLPASQEIWSLPADVTSLKLDWNESSREPSPLVRQALVELVQSDRLRYYPNVRNEALLEELACYTKCSPKTLNYFSGSDALHECIIRAFVEKGDTVCIFGPTYDNFRLISEVSGAQIRRLDFKTMFEFGASRVSLSGAKLAYICNPNNPTGEFVPPQDLLTLFDYNPDTLFVVDEAYIEFCPELSVAGCVTQYDNVIICRTLSKAFGLASIRFGYSICHPSLNDVLALVRNTKSVSMFAQVSAIAALRDEQYMMEYVREVEVVRKKTIELLTSTMGSHLKIFNGKGNFLLIEFADIEAKNKLVKVLNNNKVYVRSFEQSSPFHHCIRLSLMSLESFNHFQAVLEEEFALTK